MWYCCIQSRCDAVERSLHSWSDRLCCSYCMHRTFLLAVMSCDVVCRVKRTCFNCGGDHELSACKERRNMQRIDENRRQFYQHKLSAGKVPQGKQTRCSALFDSSVCLYTQVYNMARYSPACSEGSKLSLLWG